MIIDWQNVFDQTVKNDNIRGDYTITCLLDYNCFSKYYKMTAIDLSKQQALDADP